MTDFELRMLKLCAKGLTSTLTNDEFDELLKFWRGEGQTPQENKRLVQSRP